ncbi:MAG: ATP-binding protein [Pseudomonadota bacterium]
MQTHHMMSLMMEREATRSVLAAEMIQTVLWALILLAIAIEAPLIFNPMGREIEASLQAADSAEMAASEEARRLREAYEAKSEFLRVMSHELRTPLNAIIGLTDLLSQDPPDETRREYIDHVRGAGDHMLQLVNDVLDDGRIAAGKLLLQPKPTAVRDVVVGVAAMLKERAEVKGLVLTARGEDAAKLDIDAARLRQVLINLVGNGVKFTDAGSVAIEFEQSPADDDGAVVEIRVRDTGAGIPEEKLGSIFKEYEQLEGANAKELGTGLGLSICRKIIDAFEGEIVVESALGVGSLFTVRFAARLSASADGPEDAGSAPVAAKGEGRVLIVDDNLTNRLIVRAFLEDAGYAVLQAENGAQAIDLCVAVEDIDAVLMDIDMPVMRGDEAIWRLRAMGGRFAALSIFALTANVLPEDQKKLIEAGADGVIFKPIRRDVLTARLAGEAGPASFQAAS